MLGGYSAIFRQVGINTENPKTTMDVSSKRAEDGSITDFTQTYVSAGNTISPRTNVDGIGYYYFDGALWQKMGNAGDSTNHAWINDSANTMVKLGTKADCFTVRDSGTDFVAKDSGAVGIGTVSPASSAILDVSSSNKGVLLPQISLLNTIDATTITNPAIGLLVYNTAAAGTSPYEIIPGYYFWDGSEWKKLGSSVGSNIPGLGETKAFQYIMSISDPNGTIMPDNTPGGFNNR